MGGSSLAPEVMAAMLPPAAGRPRLTVLDSTDPATVRRVSGAINLDRTLFIVASKSGGTLETAVLYATFRAQYADRNLSDAGSHFIAITDPGTSLARRASDEGFARIVSQRFPDWRALFGPVLLRARAGGARRSRRRIGAG